MRAGAATSDIIAQYVATIRALREVDPSGVLLEAVGDPIKARLLHSAGQYAEFFWTSLAL